MSTKRNQFRKKLLVVIFGTDTKAERMFDLILIWAIIMVTFLYFRVSSC